MTLLVGISGSLRRRSFNAGLLRAAQIGVPQGTMLEIASIADIPLYNADIEEAEGLPPSVVALKEAIVGADGLLLVTPEYNNGIPACSRMPSIGFRARPPTYRASSRESRFAIIGASPGGFGTILAQNAWLSVLRTLGAQLWTGGRLMVPGASKVFDAEGNLIDDAVRARLHTFVADFAASIVLRQ